MQKKAHWKHKQVRKRNSQYRKYSDIIFHLKAKHLGNPMPVTLLMLNINIWELNARSLISMIRELNYQAKYFGFINNAEFVF